MGVSIPIYEHEEVIPVKKPSSTRSLLLNILVCLFIGVYVISAIAFVRRRDEEMTNAVSPSTVSADSDETGLLLSNQIYYYDYEPYVQTKSAPAPGTARQYYYIDLGCYDGRDIDRFVYFTQAEVAQNGNLTVIAFEPDPINHVACQRTSDVPSSPSRTVYEAAAWTTNGFIPFATERGQESRIDLTSKTRVRSIDFSQWLWANLSPEHYVYVKFTVGGAELDILEKMIADRSLSLVDYLEIEWVRPTSSDYAPRRISIEGMLDNFGMDYLFMVDPLESKRVYAGNGSFGAVPKDKGW